MESLSFNFIFLSTTENNLYYFIFDCHLSERLLFTQFLQVQFNFQDEIYYLNINLFRIQYIKVKKKQLAINKRLTIEIMCKNDVLLLKSLRLYNSILGTWNTRYSR